MGTYKLGTFVSKRWGTVTVLLARYGEGGPLAILLELENGERLGVLSVNMSRPECSEDSRDLPQDCFYMKDWSENFELADEAEKSGLFTLRADLPVAQSGFVLASAWQVKDYPNHV